MVQRNRLSAMQDVENRKRVQGLPQVLYVALLVCASLRLCLYIYVSDYCVLAC
jgi:hypothetical protein